MGLDKELEGAIRHVLTGGNHLGLLIGADHPPYTATHAEALSHYGAGDQYEIWCAWRAIMILARVCDRRAEESLASHYEETDRSW